MIDRFKDFIYFHGEFIKAWLFCLIVWPVSYFTVLYIIWSLFDA